VFNNQYSISCGVDEYVRPASENMPWRTDDDTWAQKIKNLIAFM